MSNGSTCFKYNFAIISRIANSFAESSSYDFVSPNLKIDIDQARQEQAELREVLRRIGVDVFELPCDERMPDGIFVDDVAIVINMTALICNPPTFKDRPPRHGELTAVRQLLQKKFRLKIVEVGTDKAQVEGGDVLFTGREIFVGLSTRTNMLGAQAVAKAFPDYSTSIVKVHPPAVHLKDYISMAGPEVMAIGSSAGAQKTFQEIRDSGTIGYKYITVEEDEAANVIYANGCLLHLSPDQIPRGSMVYANKIADTRVGIRMVEPLKRGGRLSSCILLVNTEELTMKFPTTARGLYAGGDWKQLLPR